MRLENRLQFFSLWLSLGIGLIFLVIYLTLTAKPPVVVSFAFSDKIGHFLAYAILMAWFGQLFTRRAQLIVLALGFVCLGISLEYLQAMGRHRHFEYADMAANTVGVISGLILTTTIFKGALHWFERRALAGRINT